LNLLDLLVATMDAEGRLVLPAEVVKRLGLRPGAAVIIDQEPHSIRVRRPVEHLAKVYLEPTNRCNLSCRTCIRNSWEETQGDMTEDTFARFLDGCAAFDSMPSIFFGGFGEPLAHPRIVQMVSRAKAIGAPNVELITNGCLLTESTSRGLIEAGLDGLWVSLDGIRPESYSDVRLGALLPDVLENLRRFKEVRRSIQLVRLSSEQRKRFEAGAHGIHDSWRLPDPSPSLGIAFVAMKRNIADLPGLVVEADKLGAKHFFVSNVLPYTEELTEEILYEDVLTVGTLPTLWHDGLKLPPMDVTDVTRKPLRAVTRGRYEAVLAGQDASGITRRCPFVEAGTTSVAWNGDVSPCLAVMHTHEEFLRGRRRHVDRHVVGSLGERSLKDIWLDPSYTSLRLKIQEFDFSPCIACGGCTMSDGNQEDCEGDEPPRCGACLWSHGLIRCP
jgi:MoaA/NifB/PqqE/SkfB family radical SAM enzyme